MLEELGWKMALLELLRLQLLSEQEEHSAYAAMVDRTRNTIAKLLYPHLMRDSAQHAEMLLSMIAYLSAGKWENEGEIRETHADILRLMQSERRAYELYGKALAEVEDLKLSALLSFMASDEARHMKILEYVLATFSAPSGV